MIRLVEGGGEETPDDDARGVVIAPEQAHIRAKLAELRAEHRALDAAVEALRDAAASDQIQLMRLKKRKLQLKDQISHLEDQLTPDIIA